MCKGKRELKEYGTFFSSRSPVSNERITLDEETSINYFRNMADSLELSAS